MKKTMTVATLLLMLVLLLTSCNAVETERGGVIKLQCEDMIDAILADDADAAYALLTDGIDKTVFLSTFEEMQEYLSGVETYELKQAGWRQGINNGLSYYQATFQMDTNAGTFYIVGIEADGYERLYSFHVTTEDALDPTFSGTLMTLADANPFQWAMIGFSAICLLFSVIMIIDCAKRRIKRKPLWILLILIGMLTLSLSYAEGQLNFNGNIGVFLFSYSYLKLFTTGAWTFRLVLPVGSILYLIFRKRLTVKEKYDSENVYFN